MENLLLNPHLKSAPSALILDADLVNVVADFIAFLMHLSPISMGLIRARLPDAESRNPRWKKSIVNYAVDLPF